LTGSRFGSKVTKTPIQKKPSSTFTGAKCAKNYTTPVRRQAHLAIKAAFPVLEAREGKFR